MSAKNYQDTSWMFANRPAPQPIDPRLADPRTLLLEKSHRPAQHQQISTLIFGAGVIGFSTFIISGLFSGVVIYLAHDTAPYVWFLIPLSAAAGLIVAAVLSILWTREAATRSWRLENEDRWYRLQRELRNMDAPDDSPVVYPATQPPTDRERLRLAGYNILNHRLVTGSDATRPECEKELGVTQSEWNSINRILIELGIKGERRWNIPPDNMRLALVKWQRCVDIREDGKAWIKDHLEAQQWRLIDLTHPTPGGNRK